MCHLAHNPSKPLRPRKLGVATLMCLGLLVILLMKRWDVPYMHFNDLVFQVMVEISLFYHPSTNMSIKYPIAIVIPLVELSHFHKVL